MDDINFDELDKAVNSVLQQKPAKAEELASEQPGSTLEVVKPDAAPEELVVEESPKEAESAKPSNSKSPQIVVPKRRGQFMDLVHPSSDMTSSSDSRTSLVSPKLSRQSGTLQPLDPSIVELTQVSPKDAGANEDKTPKPEQDIDEELKTEPKSPKKIEPLAPLEAEQGKEGEGESKEVESTEPDTMTEPKDVAKAEAAFTAIDESDKKEDEEEASASQAAGTPFIKGTEVEKRPLGAFTGSHEEPEDGEDQKGTEQAEVPEGEVVPSVLPQELSPEIVSVESDDPTRMTEELADDDPRASLAASIPKQYKPSEVGLDDEESHPVFDTKDYHQPLTPPAKKKKSGLMAVLLLVLLAALGAGAWYAIAVLKLI